MRKNIATSFLPVGNSIAMSGVPIGKQYGYVLCAIEDMAMSFMPVGKQHSSVLCAKGKTASTVRTLNILFGGSVNFNELGT